jgi:predicted PurR-regulated permease PerM
MSTEIPASRDLARIVLSVLGIGALMAGSLWVLQPFLGSLLWATTIVVATWPIMRRLQGAFGGRRGAAVAAMTVALLLVVFVPLFLALWAIIQQADRVRELGRALPTFHLPPAPAWLASVPLVGHRAAAEWAELAGLPPDELAQKLTPYLKMALAWFSDHAGTAASMLVHFLLTVILSAVLFSRGEGAAETLRRFFRRLAGERGDVMVTLSGKAIRAVALGIVVTALLQTALAGIGLFAASVPFAGLITAVVLVLCIAQLGPLLALLPPVIWLYATGSPGRGTVLLVATVLAQTIDNVVRPVLIKRGANISLLVIFPGVIGGLLWLGIIGLFIGPVVLAVTTTLLDEWITAGLGEPAPEAASGSAGAALTTNGQR